MFKLFYQHDLKDCGPACLRMVSYFYGLKLSNIKIQALCETTKGGTTMLDLKNAAEKLDFIAEGFKLKISDLADVNLPCVLYTNSKHYSVLYKIKKNRYYIADPAKGRLCLDYHHINHYWSANAKSDEGFVLELYPSDNFKKSPSRSQSGSWLNIFKYFSSYKQLVLQLILGLVLGNVLMLAVPFLTKSVVDIGIHQHNLDFVELILAGQLFLIISRVVIGFIRSWVLLQISTRVNLSILRDFLIKLMDLPMSFFDAKHIGDIIQRMNDQKKIQSFLTGSALNTFFAIFTILFYSVTLYFYNKKIFLIIMVINIIYFLWVILFLKPRRRLNIEGFSLSARNQSAVIQLLNGIQEIKLNNCEQQQRHEWEKIQLSLFNVETKSLKLNQWQQAGVTLLSQGKDILIIYFSASAVISGNMTLGAMIAIQYMVAQLSNPVEQIFGFLQTFQDAKISLERMSEIRALEDEVPFKKLSLSVPARNDVVIKNLSFKYGGGQNSFVLKNINLKIPQGKTTAIVGMSGSGKTTLIKLLLRYYKANDGEVYVGDYDINAINLTSWRAKCGVVLQDGFIFSTSIERNIALGENEIDNNKMIKALSMANLNEFVDQLPLGVKTIIGAEGSGISQGQRQRILIARAVYKDPEFIFFDEATNALDSNNESIIMENLKEFFKGRTVIIVAHRMSTVRDADNIVVLKNGNVIEQGSHNELIDLEKNYYALVKNQI
ncbi:peptidase domain-containing ABC transporter [Mucilaginibacter sp. AW1-3]